MEFRPSFWMKKLVKNNMNTYYNASRKLGNGINLSKHMKKFCLNCQHKNGEASYGTSPFLCIMTAMYFAVKRNTFY